MGIPQKAFGLERTGPDTDADKQISDFVQPHDDARPWVYWYFMDGNLRREGMDADLVAMQQAGIGGAIFLEVGTKQAEELPLNGRNFFQLLLVGAGPEGNNYTLDGLVNTDQALMTPAVILSQDAIGEFKVQSGIYPAENGFGASQINIVSKGGTNSIHGAAYMPLALGKPSGEKFVTFFRLHTQTCATQNCSGNPGQDKLMNMLKYSPLQPILFYYSFGSSPVQLPNGLRRISTS
jgi:hypothetical protein